MNRINGLFRSALLGIAGNRAAEAFALKYGMRLGATKFIAGQTLAEAIGKIRELNAVGVSATLDHLGEGVEDAGEARKYRDEYVRMVDVIADSGVDSNVSLKPTQMGLGLDREEGYANIRSVAERARDRGNFVRLDMESSPFTSATIDIARRLHSEGFDNVGTVIQAYLYRTEADVRELTAERMNLRLVKGAYKEPPSIAFPRMKDVDDNFKRIIAARLSGGSYTGVATHDENIIDWTKTYALERGVSRGSFEFQMLYGVRMALQERLAREGYRVRCYVPYGRMWYPYFVRRLAERPANLLFIVKNAFKR